VTITTAAGFTSSPLTSSLAYEPPVIRAIEAPNGTERSMSLSNSVLYNLTPLGGSTPLCDDSVAAWDTAACTNGGNRVVLVGASGFPALQHFAAVATAT
jgi:hypothetical protein